MLNNAQTRNVKESEKYISGFDSLSGAAPKVNGFFWAATFPPSKFGGNLFCVIFLTKQALVNRDTTPVLFSHPLGHYIHITDDY